MVLASEENVQSLLTLYKDRLFCLQDKITSILSFTNINKEELQLRHFELDLIDEEIDSINEAISILHSLRSEL